mmetsp:Transcript_15530/g.20873  ORF Transcript_15530/g.20873 Transcript_15530/m.20873 type:complete len:103 (-) Transcript_15530:318-626(-)
MDSYGHCYPGPKSQQTGPGSPMVCCEGGKDEEKVTDNGGRNSQSKASSNSLKLESQSQFISTSRAASASKLRWLAYPSSRLELKNASFASRMKGGRSPQYPG